MTGQAQFEGSGASFDIAIMNGLVIDGESPLAARDVGIKNGRIAALGEGTSWRAKKIVDASGMVVSPGFIDAHSHGDFIDFYPTDRQDLVTAGLRQGVTTQVVGNCGFSSFAYDQGDPDTLARHIRSLFGPEARSWPTVDHYRRALEDVGMHMNVATLIGHGSLRSSLSEKDQDPSNLKACMEAAVKAAVRAGAAGLSSGLVYMPGTTADTGELVAASLGLRGSGLPYATHVRGETDDVIRSVGEALDIARSANVPLHISHHKVAGRRNWGSTLETLKLIDSVRMDGRDVSVDVYPYTAASTSLHTLLPHWIQAGGIDEMAERLSDSQTRRRLAYEINNGVPGWENMLGAAGWSAVTIAHAPGARTFEGSTLSRVGESLNMDPFDATVELLRRAQGPITVVFEVLDEGDVRRVLQHPSSMIGSDGIPLPGKPHPRWAGSFTRVLAEYVREQNLLSLGQAIAKMSLMPAQRFLLHDRGRIAVGYAADLVVFDPAEVQDGATFDEPLARPEGIRAVVLNGEVVVEEGEFKTIRAGRFLTPHIPPRSSEL